MKKGFLVKVIATIITTLILNFFCPSTVGMVLVGIVLIAAICGYFIQERQK